MKKLLLSALCAVTAFIGSADTLDLPGTSKTWDSHTWAQSGKNYTASIENFTLLLNKGTSSTDPISPDNASIRIYAGSDLTITAPEGYIMTSVSGVTAASSKATSVAVSGTTWSIKTNLSAAGANQNFLFECTTGESSITFDGDGKQLRVKTLSITYSAVGTSDKEQAGLSFPEAGYTVEYGQEFTEPELTNPYSLTVSYESSKPEVATVDATTGEVTIVGVGTTTISAKSPEDDTYNAGNASYELTVMKKAESFSEIYAVGQNNTAEVGFPMVVTYVNGANCYVQRLNAEDFSLLYSSALTYKVGDVIPADWTCKYSPYGNLPEIVPASGTTMPESTETADVTYAKVSNITEADANRIVVIENVTFDAATPATKKGTFTGTVHEGTETINFYVNFDGTPSVAAGAYDVTCAVSTYSATKLQAYPISYAEHVATSISEVVTEGEQSGVMFDLQGRRVLTPRKGVIYVQGGKKIRF